MLWEAVFESFSTLIVGHSGSPWMFAPCRGLQQVIVRHTSCPVVGCHKLPWLVESFRGLS